MFRPSGIVGRIECRLNDGLIGELLEVRAHGKQDKRAGGEDLLVLGTHTFDLVRFFAGDPQWCSARIFQAGHEATLADVRPATEGIGPIVGDEVEAWFGFSHGVNLHFTNRAKYAGVSGPWDMELIGSKGRLQLLNDATTVVGPMRAPKRLEDASGFRYLHGADAHEIADDHVHHGDAELA